MKTDELDFGGFEDMPVPGRPGLARRFVNWFIAEFCPWAGKKLMAWIRSNEYLSALLLEDPKPEYVDYMGRRPYSSYAALKAAADAWEREKKTKGEPLVLLEHRSESTDTSSPICRDACWACWHGGCEGTRCACNTFFKNKTYKETKI